MEQARSARNGVALDFQAIAHDFPDPAGGTRRVLDDVSFRVSAGEFTAVYPSASPGGWQLIGRTEQRVWDPGAEQPALLVPGTVVRFVS